MKHLGKRAIAALLALIFMVGLFPTAAFATDDTGAAVEQVHSHVWGDWYTTAEPNCTEAGESMRECSECGATETAPIAALGHAWGEWTELSAANCTEAGSHEHSCTVCGETATEVVPAWGHAWGEWAELSAANCTEEGSHEHTCATCGETVVEVIPALGHTWGEWTELTEPDCTEEGSHEHTCSVCGETVVEAIPALGHTWGEWTELTAPTCTEEGSHEHTCSVCGVTVEEAIPALGHDWDEWVVTKEPTCEEKGEHEHVCKVCGEKETEEIEAKGHDWTEDNGVDLVKCKVCGILKLVAEGGSFDLEFDDDRWMIAGDPDANVEDYTTWDYMFQNVELTGVWADDLLTIAQTQLGYQESTANFALSMHSGRNGYTRYGAWYGIPYGDWCAMFISFCMSYAGISSEDMPYDSGCAHWVETLNQIGRFGWNGSYSPRPGDLIFYHDGDGLADHVGIVHWIDAYNGMIHTIEGNLYDRVSYREISRYDLSILGYGILPENPYQDVEPEPAAEETVQKRVAKTLDKTVDGKTITVKGLLPADAELSVVAIPLDTMAEILDAQLGDASAQEVVFAYDVSILSNGKKYDLEEYGDSVAVSISNVDAEDLTVTHVKIDVTDGNGGLDTDALNEAKTVKQESETLEITAKGDEVFFDLTSCSIITGSKNLLGAGNDTVNYDPAFQSQFEATVAAQQPLIEPVISNITEGAVVAGDKLQFDATLIVKEIPSWQSGDGPWIKYFSGYENVTATFKLPAGLLLDEATLPQGTQVIARNPNDRDTGSAHTYTILFNGGNAYTSGFTKPFTFNVLIGGNGTVNAVKDYTFGADMFTLSADYTLIGQNGQPATDEAGNVKTYTESHSTTTAGVSTTSADEWIVKKSVLEGKYNATTNSVTYTWLVEVGLKAETGSILSVETDYGRPGRDLVTKMTMGDVIQTALLKSATATPIDVTDGKTVFTVEKYLTETSYGPAVNLTNEAAHQLVIWQAGDDGEIETSAVNSDLVLNSGVLIDANLDGTNDMRTPRYTKYRVTATYPVQDDWIARYPELTAYTLHEDNTASIHTEFYHLNPQDRFDDESKDVTLPIHSRAKLDIDKDFFDNNSNPVDYNNKYGRIPYWISAAENFTVYAADNTIAKDADGNNMTGKTSYEIEQGKDYYLVPSIKYTVEERMTDAQKNYMKQTDSKDTENTPAPGSAWTVTFENRERLAKLTITKKDDALRIMSDDDTQKAGFTLYYKEDPLRPVGEEKFTYKGVLTFENLPLGTYVLKETHAPTGYTASADKEIVITEDNLNVTMDVINTQNLSRLILKKYVGTTTEGALTSASFERQFQLQRSIDKVRWDDVVGFDKLTAGTKSWDLPAFASDGTPYWYRYVETLPAGYYDPASGAVGPTGTVTSGPVQLATQDADGHWHAIPRTEAPVITMYNRQLMSIRVIKNFYPVKTNGQTNNVSTEALTTTVTLYQTTDSEFKTTPTQVGDSKTVLNNNNTADGWAQWDDLRAVDSTGKRIYYLVKEADVTGYALDATGSYCGTSTTWDVKEIPAGSGNKYVLVSFEKTNATQILQFFNVEQKIPVTIWKKDFDSNRPIAGAKVTIWKLNSNNTLGTEVVSETEIPQSGKLFYLEPGYKYVFQETTNNTGLNFHSYVNGSNSSGAKKEITIGGETYGTIDLSSYTQTYSNRTTQKSETRTINNRQDPLIKITKQDSTNASTVLAGAVYKVYVKNDEGQYVPYKVNGADVTITTTSPASLSDVTLPEGQTFYFKETTVPAGYLDPNSKDNFDNYYDKLNPATGDKTYIWVDGIGTLAAGKVTSSTVDGKNVCVFTFKNVKNSGSLAVRKYVDGKLTNGFEIAVTYMDPVSGEEKTVTAATTGTQTAGGTTTDSGKAIFNNLPVFNSDGTRVTYKITEKMTDDQKTRYHQDSADLTGITLEIGKTTEYVAGSTTEYLAIRNSTRVSYTANKFFIKPFEYGYTQFEQPFAGAMIGLFVEGPEGTWKLVDAADLSDGGTNPRASGENGAVSFTGLVRGKNYKLIELSAGEGVDDVFPYVAAPTQEEPNKMDFGEFPASGVGTTTITDAELAAHKYNVIDIPAADIADTEETSFPTGELREMLNANHWVQFHVKKWLDPGQTHQSTLPQQIKDSAAGQGNGSPYTPVDNVIFDLYRYVMPEGQTTVTYPGAGWSLVNSYTTGTLYNGTEHLNGEFLSNSEQGVNDRYVYLLVERDKGPNSIEMNPYFTHTFWQAKGQNFTLTLTGSQYSDVVVNNLTYELDKINRGDILNTSPSGPGTVLYLLGSIRLAKWKDSFDPTSGKPSKNYEPLPGAQFTITLSNGVVLETLTVGLDAVMHPNGQATAQGSTYQLVVHKDANDNVTGYTLVDYQGAPPTPATPADPEGGEGGEGGETTVTEPKKREIELTTDQVDEFDFTVGGNTYHGYGVKVTVEETYTPDGFSPAVAGPMSMYFVFADMTANHNGQSWLFNDAYYVLTGGKNTTEQLAQNQSVTSWFITNANSLIPTVAVGDTTNPSPLRIVNYPTDNTFVEVFKYGYQPIPDGANKTLDKNAAQLDEMNPSSIGRKPLNGVAMVIQKQINGAWKYWNYKTNTEGNATSAAFTTVEDGSFIFPDGLSEGTYRIWETSIGSGNSDYEIAYPSARPRQFTVTKAVVNISMYNPRKFNLSVAKVDMDGNPIDAAGFTLKSGNTTVTGTKVGNKTTYSNLGTGTYTLSENFSGYSSAYLKDYFARKYAAFAGLVDGGTTLGYKYASDGSGDWKITSVSPTNDLIAKDSEGKDTFQITVRNPKLTEIKVTKVDENGNIIKERASFTLRYKAFTGLTFGNTADQMSVDIPQGGSDANFRGWDTVTNGTQNTVDGVATFSNLKPGIYAIYESTAPAGYEIMRDTSGKKLTYAVVLTGGLNVNVTASPTTATVNVYGSGTPTTKQITTFTPAADGTTVAFNVENRKTITVKAKKVVNAGELTPLPSSARWDVTLYLYDSNEAGAKPVAGVRINQGTTQGDGLTFKAVNQSSGALTNTDYQFSLGTQYYLGETVNTPSGAAAKQFPWISYKVNGTSYTVSNPADRLAVSFETTDPITIEATNQWLYGEVRFKKLDKDVFNDSTMSFANKPCLTGAEFNEISYKRVKEDETVEWVVIPNAKAVYDDTLHMYVAKNIPLASAADTEYRIKETKAPDGYLLQPDTYLYVTLSATNNLVDATDEKALSNSMGNELTIYKISETAGPDTSGTTHFAVYHKVDGVWVQEEDGYPETTGAKAGYYTFSKLMVPGDEYGIAEVGFDPTIYSRMEGVYQRVNGVEVRVNHDAQVDFVDSHTGATKKVDLYVVSHGTDSVSMVVKNVVKVNPVIRKLDVGQYVGGDDTFPNDAVRARMHFAIYQLTGDDVNISTAAQVEAFLNPAEPATAPTPVYTGETGGYDAGTLKNGTQTVWDASDYEDMADWDNRNTYLIVETEVTAARGTYDTMRKDDPRVVWFYKLNPVADNDVTAQMAPIDLKNIYGDASVTLTKSADRAKVDSLLTGARDVVFTLTPTVKGHNQMLKSFILNEEGITAKAKDKAVPVEYTFTSIEIGKASHTVNPDFGTSFPISATVTFYDASGAAIAGADVTVGGLDAAAQTIAKENIPAEARSFSISYYSGDLRTATEAKCHDIYALGENFGAEPVKVGVTVTQQSGGSLGNVVDVITDLENSSSADLKYWKWDKNGTGTTEAGNVAPAKATVLVDPVTLPKVSIEKSSPYTSTMLEALLPYQITVKNLNDSADNFVNPVVMDILPTGVSYVTNSAPTEVQVGERTLSISTQPFTGEPTYSSKPGADGNPISGNAQAVVFSITGELKPGEQIVIPFSVRVTKNAELFADTVGGAVQIINDVYLSSTEKSFFTPDNPYGRSFTDGNGAYGVSLKDAAGNITSHSPSAPTREGAMDGHVGDYSNKELFGWIPNYTPVALFTEAFIHPVKAVMGDRDTQGFHTEGLGVVSRTNSRFSQNGWAQWSLSVVNGESNRTFKNMVIGDVIPNPGDGNERRSVFPLYFDELLVVQNNKVDVDPSHYTLYVYTGTTASAETALKQAIEGRALNPNAYADNGFTPLAEDTDKTKVTAFIIAFDETIVLASKTTMTVIYNTTFPDMQNDAEFAPYGFTNDTNYFYYNYNNDGRSAYSNKVTITVMDRPVEIQGDLWIDEDQDGTQEAGGNRAGRNNYADYQIVQNLIAATKFTITDNRAAASGSTNDTGDISQHSGGESIKHFRFENLGAAAWKNNLTEDDLYTNNQLVPNTLKGDDPYYYTLNASINDPNVLAVLGISPLGLNHYRSDDPDASGFATSTNALDNNFDGTSGIYRSAPFFIRYSNNVDQSKDIGVMMYRNLELTKVAADDSSARIAGAKFSIYGPYEDTGLGIAEGTLSKNATSAALKFSGSNGVYALDPTGSVTELETDADGKLTVTGLNWWKEYKIEEVDAPAAYKPISVTATGDSSTYTQVDMVNGSKTSFWLRVPGKEKVDPTDKVTVTNVRSVDVKLNVWKLYKSFSEDKYTFQFELRLTGVTPSTNTQNAELLKKNPIQTLQIEIAGDQADGETYKLGSFKPVTLNGVGIYTFKIKEIETVETWHGTYDSSREREVTVTVVWDAANSQLKVDSIVYHDPSYTDGTDTGALFTNKYNPEPAKVGIPVKKTLAGNDPPEDMTFNFTLTGKDNAPMPAGTGNKTSITIPANSAPAARTGLESKFGEIEYVKTGTYEYTITEEQTPKIKNVTYSTLTYDVTVTVTDTDKDGKLEAVYAFKNGEAAATDALFTNTYTPTPVELVIPVKKVISGGTVPSTKEKFRFTIEASSTGAPLPNPAFVEVIGAAAENEGSFGNIKYTEAGTYVYIVREARGSNNHYSYDMSYWTVTVKVEDVDNELKVTEYTVQKTEITTDATATETNSVTKDAVSIKGDALKAMHDSNNVCTLTDDSIKVVFTNPYTPEPVKLKIPVKKLVTLATGSKDPDAIFTFDLVAKDGAPMPVVNDQTITKDTVVFHWPADKDKTIEFHEITFREAGTYKYTVTEQEPNPRIPGVTYDTTPRNVTVTVTVGTDDKLIVHYTVEGVEGQDKPVEVTNEFDEPKVDVEVEKIWEDDDDQDAIRPRSITVTLKRSYTKVGEQEATVENVETVNIMKTTKTVDGKEVEAWEYKWEKLPKYFEMTQLITYSVTEAKIEAPAGFQNGYADTYAVEPKNPTPETTKFSIKITNTHEPERIDFEFTKVGEDVPAEGSTATTSTYSPLAGVEFTLYTDEACTTIATKPDVNGNPVELKAVSAPTTGVVKFEKLPMYKVTTAEDGTETKEPMVYYMKETNLGDANKDLYWDNSTIYKLEVVPKTATEPAKIVMTEVPAATTATGGGNATTGGNTTGGNTTGGNTTGGSTTGGSTTGSAATGDNTAAAEKPEPIRTGKLVSTTVDGKLAYTIQNDLVKYKVKLLKKDEKDKTPLAKAEFALYHKGDLEKVTTDGKTEWKPKDGAKAVKTNIVTDAKGEAELGWISREGKLWLLPGEYELLETKAPDGYFPIEDPISIKIEKGKASYQQPGADKATELTLENVASFTVEVTNKPKYGDLKIIKYLPTYEMSEEATFVFDVVGTDPTDETKVVYSNVAVLTLTKEGSKFTVLHHIPVGAKITVKERYTGSHYECEADEQTTTIVANRTVSVNFTNTYNYEDNGGHGLANVFNPNTNGGWTHDGVTTRTSTPADQPLEDYTPEAESPANPQAEPVAEED